ncbi:MAG: hypothetical protein Q4B52_06865 [Tissierellia bacterium]|nr:hypothetical protein [Tissierellia bacterium]
MHLKARKLRQIDNLYHEAERVMVNRKAEITETRGDKQYYKYKTPDELVDVKYLENQINSNQVSKNKRLVEVAKRVKKLRGRREDE